VVVEELTAMLSCKDDSI
jgi:hypothetical protein